MLQILICLAYNQCSICQIGNDTHDLWCMYGPCIITSISAKLFLAYCNTSFKTNLCDSPRFLASAHIWVRLGLFEANHVSVFLKENKWIPKGQIIWKGLFGILKFSQFTKERIRRSNKNKFVRSFFGRIFGEQKSFRNYLTFINNCIFFQTLHVKISQEFFMSNHFW